MMASTSRNLGELLTIQMNTSFENTFKHCIVLNIQTNTIAED